MDDTVTRLALAAAALALGWAVGVALRRSSSRPLEVTATTAALPMGVYVVVAPFCARCTSLRQRLEERNIQFRELDAREEPDLVTQLGVRSAPTLLVIDGNGQIAAMESANFDPDRVKALAAAASPH